MNREERYRARREARLDLHARRGPILPWDVAATIAILVGASVVLPVVTTLSTLAASAGASCDDQACLVGVGIGVGFGLALPILILFVGVAVSVVRLFRHLRGWRTAVVTVVAIALCLPLAVGVIEVGARL